jgi:hypothetical protein
MRYGGKMRIADDTEAIARRYRELFQPSSEQPTPPKPEPETKSAAEKMCRCGRPVSDCFFCVGGVITGLQAAGDRYHGRGELGAHGRQGLKTNDHD